MADTDKLSIHQVTLLQQCSTPQFLEVMARNDVPCASLWRDKVREHGVEATASARAPGGGTSSAASLLSATTPRFLFGGATWQQIPTP